MSPEKVSAILQKHVKSFAIFKAGKGRKSMLSLVSSLEITSGTVFNYRLLHDKWTETKHEGVRECRRGKKE